jgi:proline iminopeptidase
MVAHSGGPGIGYGYLRSPELERNFTMVYVEPIGTGASGRLADRGGYRLEAYVRFLAALVDRLGQPAVTVLGHSYGGFVAQQYALEHPDRVAGLVLYDTSPVTGPAFWSAAIAALESYPQRYPDQPRAAEVPAAFTRALTATSDDSLSEELRAALPVYLADYWTRRTEFRALETGLVAWADPAHVEEPPFDVRERLGEITAPALIIAGRHDFICGPRFAVLLHQGIAGSRLVVLEHSGHLGHLEQPAEFARAVTEVLLAR